MYKDSVYSNCKNYKWPLIEINIFSGFDVNSWMIKNYGYIVSLDDFRFTEKEDGIYRSSELGTYEIEMKINTAKIDFTSSYYSHFLPYQSPFEDDETEYINTNSNK